MANSAGVAAKDQCDLVRNSFVCNAKDISRLAGSGLFHRLFVAWECRPPGLIGSHGILPFAGFLEAAYEAARRSAYRRVPTVLWLYPTRWRRSQLVDWRQLCRPGGDLSDSWQRTALAVCLVLWLSLCSVGQDFLSFQWDILLSEAGFLAIFADTSAVSHLALPLAAVPPDVLQRSRETGSAAIPPGAT